LRFVVKINHTEANVRFRDGKPTYERCDEPQNITFPVVFIKKVDAACIVKNKPDVDSLVSTI